MQWYLKVLKNYVGFRGRARRKEYWMFFLIHVIVFCVLAFLGEVVSKTFLSIAGMYVIAMTLPMLAVRARRLHDTGKTGWLQLLSFIPIIGRIVLLIFFCQNSQEDDNKYGPNPKFDGKC
ncbi:DUF805 domain-containing protein [Bacillus sp. NPDC077411]|uniref:DUF805 domain-containing protein n=1 Tax=Bacillus bruguierae TaxID=3127667 RepID=A0ABU8FJ43_9BACI|nr:MULTISPECIES: DUF805 domain-containing protein [unclassified Bacillus (in: firmicutes)]SFJ74413.1 Uncharacterized membrane protein YhaH, DUF805 family [Bacillus sp. 71mf]SFS69054.1 Uncharacterized membrane protein YhaH, DUF805 family [Bacillus sp. 103mf]